MTRQALTLSLLAALLASPALGQARREPPPPPDPLSPPRTIDPGEVLYILDGITVEPREAVREVRERSEGGIRYYYAALRDDTPVWVFDAINARGNLNADVHGQEGWMYHPPRWRILEPRWTGEGTDWMFLDLHGGAWIFDAHDKVEELYPDARVFAAEAEVEMGDTVEEGVAVEFVVDAILEGEAVRFRMDQSLEIIERGPTPEPEPELNPKTAPDGRKLKREQRRRERQRGGGG